ncbi:MAG TPA: PA domain-containing protein [Chthoniobacterales bacterium]|nr:PA domain-containing protein [Chthoniobacterales bacterium]
MKFLLRTVALAAFAAYALHLTRAALPVGISDVAVDIAFYNSRVVGMSGPLNGQTFRAIYAATSPRDRVQDKNIVYAIPHDASAPLYNSTQVAGNIVLIDRGYVEFDVQAANARTAGAAGIIVVNNIGDPTVPTMQQTTTSTGVPDAMISQNDGDAIKAASNFDPSTGVAPAATLSTVTLEPDIQADKIVKLNAANGNILWYTLLGNDNALAVDPVDLGVYTALGGHNYGNNGFTFKLDNTGALIWANTVSLNSYCDFFYVTNVAVDAFSASPGVVWSENGCFGALAKSDRSNGTQLWSLLTYDLSRPSIDPNSGLIYSISNAGSAYNANTIYSVTADGVLSSANSCEGLSDLNPADGQLYRGGGTCGLVLSQVSTANLGIANWTINLSSYLGSIEAIAVQPWQGGYVYVASVASSKIVVVDPVTQTVVTSFSTALAPKYLAVDPNGGNVYIADDTHPTVIAYGPTGALLWINPNLGGTVTSLAAARGVVGVSAIPTATAATTAATNVTDVTATLNGTVNPNGSSTTVYFEYGTTTAYGSQTAHQVFTGSSLQNVTANISGLTTGVTYHYRLVAINGGGSITGGDVSFVTAATTPTPTPTPTPTCAAPTVRIASDRNSLHKGESATITMNYGAGSATPCTNVTVYFTVKTKAKNGVDFTFLDANGQDATQVGVLLTGPLTLTNLYTSRKKTLPVQIALKKDRAYYDGNTKVTVQLLAK